MKISHKNSLPKISKKTQKNKKKSKNFSDQKVKIAILISGRGSNMQALFNSCKLKNFPAQIALILSNNPQAAGLDFARKNHLNCAIVNHRNFCNEIDPRKSFEIELDRQISNSGAELICLAGFMRILSPWFVKKWQGKIINIHPSLLPSFKGGNAVFDALQAGVKITGCTTHFVDCEIDSGEIIMQKAVKICKSDDKEKLAKRILAAEHQIYSASLKSICKKLQKTKSEF